MTIRNRLEETERKLLSSWAFLAGESKGRARPEAEHDYRTAFQRDRDRILHSKAFRRLKGKTQVFLAPEGDHYRTRLTHTLEVAQISRTVSRALALNEDLTEAIALGHDLGHTPFGHAGEAVLNELFDEGFRHYEQSLRVVDFLETTRHGPGLNLTGEVRDGILHHSKGRTVLLGRSGHCAATMEGRIMSVCDAIAYVSHDIDDAIRGGVITLADLPPDAIAVLGATTSEQVNTMTVGLIEGSQDGNVGFETEVGEALNGLREYLYRSVYPSVPINGQIEKAKKILRELYAHLMEHGAEGMGTIREGDSPARQIVDFIAGMTDHYALQLYQRLFFPITGPV